MNHRLIDALMSSLAPVIRDYLAGGLATLSERIKAVEARESIKGDKGEPGLAGRDGIDGTPGRDGQDGQDGLPGARGEKGDPGAVGERGLPGEKGIDGRDGQPGVAGRDGKDGTAGLNGRDGVDGLGFDDIQVEHDGERGFVFRFVRGDQVKEFGKFIVPVTIYRGVWKDGDFQRGDEVTLRGSQFIAKRDTKSMPETNDDWQLACKRGRDGRDGKPGDRGMPGAKGERGEPGPRGYGG